MDAKKLKELLAAGETSKVQFKEKIPHAGSLAREIVAMSNSLGGMILFGIKDVSGDVTGLTVDEVEAFDKTISEVADHLKPPVYLTTEVVTVFAEDNPAKVLVVHIDEGINKPYKTAKGEIYVKQASNKRLLTDNAEIMRLFQRSGNLLADEMEVHETTIEDVDEIKFSVYFKKEFNNSFNEKGLTFEQALKAKRVVRNNKVTLGGLLFFGKEPQTIKPAFTVKLVSFVGNDMAGSTYRNKPGDLKGTIPEIFEKALNFLLSNLRYLQVEESFNSPGRLEVSQIALEELLQNALIHRDYFKNAPVRVFVFDNRIEIISPGKLPNGLTVEEIKYGNPVIRNNLMVAFGLHSLPFSGLGSGIKRSLEAQPDIELINDVEGDQFIVKIPRPAPF